MRAALTKCLSFNITGCAVCAPFTFAAVERRCFSFDLARTKQGLDPLTGEGSTLAFMPAPAGRSPAVTVDRDYGRSICAENP
jgi:hypothetical protein